MSAALFGYYNRFGLLSNPKHFFWSITAFLLAPSLLKTKNKWVYLTFAGPHARDKQLY